MSAPRQRSGKTRGLTPEDLELWRIVTANVRPRVPQKRPEKVETRQPVWFGAVEKKQSALATHRPDPTTKPLGPIERQTRRDLDKGRIHIDARLDLHGLTLADAHVRVGMFLARAQNDGARIVLIVTGKGKRREDGYEVGPLRRQTPMWLADPRLRHIVAAFGEATPAHGGAGALYVRIRKR
jgi:DNA-nicking Smr family endonuclease